MRYGWFVVGLRARGYDIEGVDYAEETIQILKDLFPELPVRAGDVTNLDVDDGYYSGYISLGVIEHRKEGPEPFLQEAHRVLTQNGIALISVPYFHSLRRLKCRWGMYLKPTDELHFYQYAFSKEELLDLVTKHGFQVLDTFKSFPIEGLLEELPGTPLLMKVPQLNWTIKKLAGRLPLVRHYWGHMMMVVAQKV